MSMSMSMSMSVSMSMSMSMSMFMFVSCARGGCNQRHLSAQVARCGSTRSLTSSASAASLMTVSSNLNSDPDSKLNQLTALD